MPAIHRRVVVAFLGCLPFVLSCGGDSGTGPEPAPPTPAAMQDVGGSGQQATVGTTLPNQLVVEVLGSKGEPIGGVTVSFTVVSGGGTVTPATSITSSSGQARTTFTLGGTAGVQAVTARFSPLSPVMFTATAVAGAAAQLSVLDGAPPSAPVGAPLPTPVRLRVSDAQGNPVAGIPLAAVPGTGSGSVTMSAAATDASGELTAVWTLGTTPGAQSITISVPSQPTITPATLTATAVPGPPDTIRAISGDIQTADAGDQLPAPLVVRVSDAYGNAIPNQEVIFAVQTGGGSVSHPIVQTGAEGRASTTWILGPLAGGQSVSATAMHPTGGRATLMTAMALAPSPAALWRLQHGVVDAVYASATNRIVTVGANPSRLTIVDPEGRTEQSVPLVQVPLSVAVDPSGAYAAVSHDGLLSYVNLASGTVQQTFAMPSAGGSVVLAGNGFAYVFPRFDQWVNVQRIELATGTHSVPPHSGTYAGVRAKLHPSGDFIYGANNGLSPSDFLKFDIQNGAATLIYDSPYHGQYSFAGDIWITEDGTRLFARSGNVFTSSPVRAEDILYVGTLAGITGVRSAVQPADNSRLYVLGSTGHPFDPDPVTELRLYEPQFLSYGGSVVLPKFRLAQSSGGSIGHRGEGRFLFVNAAATKVYVLVRAPSAAGLAQDWGVAVFDVGDLP